MRTFFKIEYDKFLIFRLEPASRTALSDFLFDKIRDCYVPLQTLKNAKAAGRNLAELIAAYVPDNAVTRSCEFAETTSFNILARKCGLPLSGPAKWRWKEEKNIPLKKTDVLLFNMGAAPSPDDVLVSAETKSKATAAKDSQLLAAIEGADEDRLGRIGRSLVWFKDRAIQENDMKMKAVVERFQFSDRPGNGTYHKHPKAILFIDSALLADELAKAFPDDCYYRMEVLIIAIDDLRGLYNSVYDRVINDHVGI